MLTYTLEAPVSLDQVLLRALFVRYLDDTRAIPLRYPRATSAILRRVSVANLNPKNVSVHCRAEAVESTAVTAANKTANVLMKTSAPESGGATRCQGDLAGPAMDRESGGGQRRSERGLDDAGVQDFERMGSRGPSPNLVVDERCVGRARWRLRFVEIVEYCTRPGLFVLVFSFHSV